MGNTFRALSHRNYRLFFIGQSISLIGSWMQQMAMSWLIYRITGSAILLGTVGFVSLIPATLLAPFAGVWIDRLEKRRVIMFTQCAYLFEATCLTILTLTNTIQTWEILVLAAMMGIATAFDVPARQSFMIEVVEDRRDLSNVIALNSAQFNLARLIGPFVAGVVIQVVKEGWCFGINALSFIAVLYALSLMTTKHVPKDHEPGQVLSQLREGASYVGRSIPIRTLLLFLSVVSMMGGVYSVLFPVFAVKVFHGNAHTLSWLLVSVGLGALLAAIFMATRSTVLGFGKLILWSAVLFAFALLGFAFAPNIYLSCIALVVVGFGGMANMAATNTMIQTIVHDSIRGRVMAWYSMSFLGTMPIGSLLSGIAADHYGVHATIATASAITLLSSAIFFSQLPKIRAALLPIYEAKGISRNPAPMLEPAESG